MCHHPGAQGSRAITRGWRSMVSLPDPVRTVCTADGHSNPKLILTLLSPGILLLFPKLLKEISTSKIKERKSWGVECQPWSISGPMGKANLLSPIQPWFSTKKKRVSRTEPTGLPLCLSFHSFYHASPSNIPTFTTCWQVNSSNSWIRARIT